YLAILPVARFALQVAQFKAKAVSLEKPFQHVVGLIKLARCHTQIHRAKHLARLEVLHNSERQQHEDRENERHVQPPYAASQAHAKTNQEHRGLFRIANVGTETDQRSRGKYTEGPRGAIAHN